MSRIHDETSAVTPRSVYSLWSPDYGSDAVTQWLECPIERVTPKFIWCWGKRLSRTDIDQHGRDCYGNYYVAAQVPSDAKRVTLAEQAEEWLRRKVDIRAADEAYKVAAQRAREASEQAIAAAHARLANNNETLDAACWQAAEASRRASDACDEAWKQRNRYTVYEIERASDGWRHPGEAAR